MKIFSTTLALVVALSATSAMAFGDVTTNTAAQNQNQGQAQGQIQGQLQGQDQSQNANANNNNAVSSQNSYTSEGSVSASVGAAACANGITLGVPAVGAIGGSWSDRDCKIVNEAAALADLGRPDLAISHLTHTFLAWQTQ